MTVKIILPSLTTAISTSSLLSSVWSPASEMPAHFGLRSNDLASKALYCLLIKKTVACLTIVALHCTYIDGLFTQMPTKPWRRSSRMHTLKTPLKLKSQHLKLTVTVTFEVQCVGEHGQNNDKHITVRPRGTFFIQYQPVPSLAYITVSLRRYLNIFHYIINSVTS